MSSRPNRPSTPPVLAVALVAAVLAGCSGSDAPQSTQAVARVNDKEISVHQINMLAQRLPANLPAERIAEARRTILNTLVEQEKLVQYAIEHKLDREAATMQQLEAVRREVLARAAVERLGSQSPKPTSEEVRTYFEGNPGLFANRRIYRFDEIVMPGVPVNWQSIEPQVLRAKSLREVSAVLKAANIDLPTTQGVVRASEALPMNRLADFSKRKAGDIVVWAQPPRVVIGQVIDVREAAVDEARAAPLIEQALGQRKRQETIASETTRLSEAAKVSYLGEFAQDAAATAASAAPARAAEDPSKTVDQALSKGVAGLK
jgi:EpsD family peptidyl-prolyl cis-trans isomerase